MIWIFVIGVAMFAIAAVAGFWGWLVEPNDGDQLGFWGWSKVALLIQISILIVTLALVGLAYGFAHLIS